MDENFPIVEVRCCEMENNHVMDVEGEKSQMMVVVGLMVGHVMGRRRRYFRWQK